MSQEISSADWRDQVTWYTHETVVARVIKVFGRLFFRTIAHIEYSGVENIPMSGRLVMASNHISNFDVPFIVINLPRHPFFMAKQELFRYGFGWIIRMFGGFSINRGERDPWALIQAGRVLEAEGMLFMFPEGTRSGRKAQLKRGKIGAIKLALEYQAPILPMAVWGTQTAKIGWKANNIYLHFGEPLDVVSLAGPPPYNYETYQRATEVMMQHIAILLPPKHRGVYSGEGSQSAK